MRTEAGSSRDGPYVKGFEAWWQRSAPGGSYDRGWGFFTLHWEAKDRDPGVIRLHVETPKRSVDPALSDLKRRLIDAILSSDLRELAVGSGLKTEIGSQIHRAAGCKCTTVLKVVLPQGERGDHEHNLRVVHAAVGAYLDGVLLGCAADLDQLLPARA